MYESPITQMLDEMKMHYEDGVYKAVQNVGFHVDKEELAKALQYDRGQYNKGYKDGYAKAIDEFAEQMKELFKHIKVAESVIDMVVKEMKGE